MCKPDLEEKVIKGLEMHRLRDENCYHCPYDIQDKEVCVKVLCLDALELLKEKRKVIEKYHKADVFLAVHGWKWN